MDLRKLKTILDLFENSSIQELEITEGEEKLRLTKGAGAATQVQNLATAANSAPQASAQSAAGAEVGDAQPEEGNGAQPAENEVELRSPMVGTYYERPSEDEPPFVKVGDRVEEGAVVCIIEAMKLFNNVTAPVTGTIKRIEATNEQVIGYGDLLMLFEKD